MIKFRNYPILRPLPHEGLYELEENLNVVYTDDNDVTKAVLVPKGFKTDGASIPRLLWLEVGSPFQPSFITAAIVHDWHCSIRDGKVNNIKKDSISVDEMSDLFFDLLREDGVGLINSFSMEQAVRLYKTLF
jgi:hypothetical protein